MRESDTNHPNHDPNVLPSSCRNFEIIHRSVSYDANDLCKDLDEDDCADPCGCKPFSRNICGDSERVCCVDARCMNFSAQIECVACLPKICKNNRFQTNRYASLYVKETPGKDHGLFTREDLVSGQFVMEYVGELISGKEVLKRMVERGGKHLYVMQLKPNAFLDAMRKGSITRFINHSCSPNCTIETWTVAGHLRVGIFTLKNIPAESELSFDYQWSLSSQRAPTKCYCGSSNCRGYIELGVDEMSALENNSVLQRKGKWLTKDEAMKIVSSASGMDYSWLVGKVVRIFWDGNQQYFDAEVMSYSKDSGKYTCVYDIDGNTSEEDLLSESVTWEWLDITQEALVIKKKSLSIDEESELECLPIVLASRASQPSVPNRYNQPTRLQLQSNPSPVTVFTETHQKQDRIRMSISLRVARVFIRLYGSIPSISPGVETWPLAQVWRGLIEIIKKYSVIASIYPKPGHGEDDLDDIVLVGSDFAVNKVQEMIQNSKDDLIKQQQTLISEQISRLSRLQGATIAKDWRLAYAPFREIFVSCISATQKPSPTKSNYNVTDQSLTLLCERYLSYVASSPNQPGHLIYSYLQPDVANISDLLILYQVKESQSIGLSPDKRAHLISSLSGIMSNLKYPISSVCRVHCAVLLMRYCSYIKDEDAVKDAAIILSGVIILAHKALGLFHVKLIRKIVLGACSQIFNRPESEFLKNSTLDYFLKGSITKESLILQALGHDIYLPNPLPGLFSRSTSQYSNEMIISLARLADEGYALVYAITLHFPDIHGLFTVDVVILSALLVHGCYHRYRSFHSSSSINDTFSSLTSEFLSAVIIPYICKYQNSSVQLGQSSNSAVAICTNILLHLVFDQKGSVVKDLPWLNSRFEESYGSGYTSILSETRESVTTYLTEALNFFTVTIQPPRYSSVKWKLSLPSFENQKTLELTNYSSWKDLFVTSIGQVYRAFSITNKIAQDREVKKREHALKEYGVDLGVSWTALTELSYLLHAQYFNAHPSSFTDLFTIPSEINFATVNMSSKTTTERYLRMCSLDNICGSIASVFPLLAEGQIPSNIVKRWCFQAINAALQLENSGIFLRWLSIDHVYISSQGNIIFGELSGATLSTGLDSISNASRETSEVTSAKSSVGTMLLGMTPPEIILGGVPSKACNIWIAGALCYYFLTGKPLTKTGSSEEKHLTYLYKILGTPRAAGWSTADFDALPYANILPRKITDETSGALTESKCRLIKVLRSQIHPTILASLSLGSSSIGSIEKNTEKPRDKLLKQTASNSAVVAGQIEGGDGGYILDMTYMCLQLVPTKRATSQQILELPLFVSPSISSFSSSSSGHSMTNNVDEAWIAQLRLSIAAGDISQATPNKVSKKRLSSSKVLSEEVSTNPIACDTEKVFETSVDKSGPESLTLDNPSTKPQIVDAVDENVVKAASEKINYPHDELVYEGKIELSGLDEKKSVKSDERSSNNSMPKFSYYSTGEITNDRDASYSRGTKRRSNSRDNRLSRDWSDKRRSFEGEKSTGTHAMANEDRFTNRNSSDYFNKSDQIYNEDLKESYGKYDGKLSKRLYVPSNDGYSNKASSEYHNSKIIEVYREEAREIYGTFDEKSTEQSYYVPSHDRYTNKTSNEYYKSRSYHTNNDVSSQSSYDEKSFKRSYLSNDDDVGDSKSSKTRPLDTNNLTQPHRQSSGVDINNTNFSREYDRDSRVGYSNDFNRHNQYHKNDYEFRDYHHRDKYEIYGPHSHHHESNVHKNPPPAPNPMHTREPIDRSSQDKPKTKSQQLSMFFDVADNSHNSSNNNAPLSVKLLSTPNNPTAPSTKPSILNRLSFSNSTQKTFIQTQTLNSRQIESPNKPKVDVRNIDKGSSFPVTGQSSGPQGIKKLWSAALGGIGMPTTKKRSAALISQDDAL